MVIDFSGVDITERPTLILRNLDDTAIGILNNALELEADFYYNEVSQISFEYPSQIDGIELPEYELITGMRVVDMDGYGQFLIQNPEEEDNGIVRKKTVKAYSLEYELTNKMMYLDEGTYNFWNPLTPDSTILGIICSEALSWSVGEVSSDLIGKYRTFEVVDQNIYDWIKNDLQDTYACIFDFDTYNRTINVRSVEDSVSVNPIYLSTSNLIQEIEIEEDTDDMVTCLDVYGADDVNIRSVNPMGTNKIYNLDAYMTTDYFSEDMIEKWSNWKTTFDSYQETYYNLVIALYMKNTEYTVAEGELAELEGELVTLNSVYSVQAQAYNQGLVEYSDVTEALADVTAKEEEISEKEAEIEELETDIETITASMVEINEACAFSAFFTDDELEVLDRYFICGTLTDTTFVATSTNSYGTSSTTVMSVSETFYITNLTSITTATYGDDTTFYILHGGTITVSGSDVSITAEIVNGTLQYVTDNSFILTLYLNEGSSDETDFESGNLSLTGTLSSAPTVGDDSITLITSSASVYLTQDVSVYQQVSIQQELYEYAVEFLERQSEPTYYFSIESANFLALDDFVKFASSFALGDKVYIETSMGVLTPIAIGASIDFDDLSKFSLEFGNAYTINDSSFKLEDILDQSVSMGRTLDYNQYNYSNFVTSGASTTVETFITSAIDTMKNAILAGTNEEITIDGSGIRLRNYDSDTDTYDDEQIWLAHNAIMFTDDNWESAQIGIGKFEDTNLGTIYGVVAPAIVGTILAGENLVIESEKQDGGVAVFKVDAEGASLHNALFNLYQADPGTGRIAMTADYGIIGGADYSTMFSYDAYGSEEGVLTSNGDVVTTIDEMDSDDSPNANFWLDMNGDVYLKGTIEATAGVFSGSIEIGGSTGFRVDTNGNTSIGGTSSNAALNIGSNGWLRIGGNDTQPNLAVYPNGDLCICGNWGNSKFSVYHNGVLNTNGSIYLAGALTTNSSITSSGSIYSSGTINSTGAINAGGTLYAANANINGTIRAKSLYINGTNALDSTGNNISGNVINAKGIVVTNTAGCTTFQVYNNGTVVLNGNITLSSGSSINWASVTETNCSSSNAYSLASTANSTATNASTKANSALNDIANLANGTYNTGTFINKKIIYSPTVYADTFAVRNNAGSYGAIMNMAYSSTSSADTTTSFQLCSCNSIRLQTAACNSYNAFIQAGNTASYLLLGGNTVVSLRGNHIGLGVNACASGNYAFVTGLNSIANSFAAIAMGNNCHAYNESAVAIGFQTCANALAAVAMGYATNANYRSSSAFGQTTRTTAMYQMVTGYNGNGGSDHFFSVVNDGTVLFYVNGSGGINCSGTKARSIKTNSYGTIGLFSIESPQASFEDIGEGVIDDTGVCYTELSPIFTETIRTDVPYQVFLQKYGVGDLYVLERNAGYFVAAGTAGLPFGWRVYAPQADVAIFRYMPNGGAAEGDVGVLSSEATAMSDTAVSDYEDLEVDYAEEAATEVAALLNDETYTEE